MKRILTLMMVFVMLTAFAGCSSQPNDISEEKQQETEVRQEQSFLEDYIGSMAAEKRARFLVFHEGVNGFCQSLEAALDEGDFVGEFEFDPFHEDEVPAALEAVYSFQTLVLFSGAYLFKDIKMTVKDNEVTLSYDGHEFYPRKYDYTDIQEIIDRINAE